MSNFEIPRTRDWAGILIQCNGFNDCNNFSKGSSKPRRHPSNSSEGVMVSLERMLDYRGVGLERFHCTLKISGMITLLEIWKALC